MLNQGTVTDNVAHVDLGVEMWSVVWPVYRNKCMFEGLAALRFYELDERVGWSTQCDTIRGIGANVRLGGQRQYLVLTLALCKLPC